MKLWAVFSLFVSGMLAGSFYSAIPWLVGYVIRLFRRIVA